MGGSCCAPKNGIFDVRTIPDPTGEPIDPLLSKEDIIEAINWDPHINYFKNQIEGVMMPQAR
jgi:hypothetical protein